MKVIFEIFIIFNNKYIFLDDSSRNRTQTMESREQIGNYVNYIFV